MVDYARVVITGIGIVSPFGAGKRKFWSGIRNHRSAIRSIKNFETRSLPQRVAGEVPETVTKRYFGRNFPGHISRATSFGLIASKLALVDAGLVYPVPNKKGPEYGVSLGISVGNIDGITVLDKGIQKDGPKFISPAAFPNVCPNASASHISMAANITGFSTTFSNPSSSGLDAIFNACTMLRRYGYSVVLAGGAEALSRDVFEALSYLKCLPAATRGKKKAKLLKPFDKERAGMFPGEGACLFVLESLAGARRRKADIYAEIKGFGSSFDPLTKAGLSRNSDGVYSAMRRAIECSGKKRMDVACIFGSANSTKGGDRTEARAIERLCDDYRVKIPVTAIKSMTGEAFSVSGPFNIAAAIMTLATNTVPAVLNYREGEVLSDINVVKHKALRLRSVTNVLVNANSSNGFNSSMIIGGV